MKKNAFTLAEVLVTLGIIGVIAAVTVPGLKKYSEEQTHVAGAKKAYSVLSNATQRIKDEKGPVRFWSLAAPASVAQLYKDKMNYLENNLSYTVKYLNGSAYNNPNMFKKETSFITQDGMLYYVQSTDATCKTKTPQWKGCIDLGVDVNGEGAPNIIGVDVFGFYVTSDGEVFPEGSVDGVIDSAGCSASGSGWSCSEKIIRTEKITW